MLDICEIPLFSLKNLWNDTKTKNNTIFAIFKTKIVRQFAQKNTFLTMEKQGIKRRKLLKTTKYLWNKEND